MVSGRAEILVGCCGFALPQAQYFRKFRLLEVQQSFYQPPSLETARKWRNLAPESFIFTVKAWQLITHEPTSPTYRRLGTPIKPSERSAYGGFRPTPEVLAAWERTQQIALVLRAPLVVFQCPPSFKPDPCNLENMRRFFAQIPRDSMALAWEPRGLWPQELVGALCQELDLIHCVDPFRGLPVWGDMNYFRLHGITGYGYSFTQEDLKRLLFWCQGKTTWVLFNNLNMAKDAARFQILLEKF